LTCSSACVACFVGRRCRAPPHARSAASSPSRPRPHLLTATTGAWYPAGSSSTQANGQAQMSPPSHHPDSPTGAMAALLSAFPAPGLAVLACSAIICYTTTSVSPVTIVPMLLEAVAAVATASATAAAAAASATVAAAAAATAFAAASTAAPAPAVTPAARPGPSLRLGCGEGVRCGCREWR